MAGVKGSGLVQAQGFKLVQDPYSLNEYVAVKAVEPDWALIHVEKADREGNAVMWGSKYDDVLLAKASKKVIITCEQVVATEELQTRPEGTDIPGFLVQAVVEAPRGAWPCSCGQTYPFDSDFFQAYLTAAGSDQAYAKLMSQVLSGERGPVQ